MNLLLVTADQWRGDSLGAVGHPCVRTPHLDRLAAEGVLFRRHYGQATPCGPARASLYTGLYALNHRSITNGTPLDRRHTHLARELRALGRAPAVFGYTDTSADPRGLAPADPRLRSYEGFAAEWDVVQPLLEDGGPWLAWLEEKGFGRLDLADVYGGELGAPAPFAAEHSEAAFLVERFLAWLGRQEAGWCAHVSFIKPHPPLVAPAPFHAAVHPDDVPAPTGLARDAVAALHPYLRVLADQPRAAGWWDEPADDDAASVRRARAVHYGLVEHVDAEIGRLVAALEARGELDDTLVVVTSDHGEMLGDHGLWGKAGFFPQAFHVPLVVRGPGVARGRRVDAITEHVDLLPTLVEAFGGTAPLQADGRSLAPWLAGDKPADWRRAAFYEHDFRDLETATFERALGLDPDHCQLAALVGEGLAYVHFNGMPPLAFDLARDPEMTVDIAGERARASEVLEAAQAMLTRRMDAAERRLTGAKLTPGGVIGRFA
jgi:arylsulfatase A-like enzyme